MKTHQTFLNSLGNIIFDKDQEQVCCKKWQKSHTQEAGLGNRGPLEQVLNHFWVTLFTFTVLLVQKMNACLVF